MIEIKINDTAYNIPSSWNDITYSHYCKIIESKESGLSERISVYSGMPLEVINKVNLTQLNYITGIVEFMDFPDVVDSFSLCHDFKLKVADEMYWRMEACKQAIKKAKSPLIAGADLVKNYTSDKDGNGGTDISDKPVTECIGQVLYLIKELTDFWDRFKRLNEYKPTEDELEAGINALNNLSPFSVPLSIARRTNQTPEQIMQRPAEEIYMIMLVDFEESEYEKRFRQVQEQNEAIKAQLRK